VAKTKTVKSYTFHVSIPGMGRLWRKLELRGDQMLSDLHLAIQDAFNFDNDHLYSFFMSGKAWDRSTEYALPEGVGPYELPEDMPDQSMPFGEAVDIGALLEHAFQAFVRELADPKKTSDARLREVFGNVDVPLNQLRAMLNMSLDLAGDPFGALMGDKEGQGDVRTTTLDSLKLKVGQTFLYLFDYGDEWHFQVRVHAINDSAPAGQYPRIVDSVGDPPPQYGEWGEEEGDIGPLAPMEVHADPADDAKYLVGPYNAGKSTGVAAQTHIRGRCMNFLSDVLAPLLRDSPTFGEGGVYEIEVYGRKFTFVEWPKAVMTYGFGKPLRQIARMEYLGDNRFNLARRNGSKWQDEYKDLSLQDAFDTIARDERFR
jgi:hypothetical protein